MLKFFAPGAPFFLLGASALFLYLLSIAVSLPTPAEIIDILSPLYDRYGVLLVTACYFLEGFFVLNFYWPGSFVLFVAVLLTPHTQGLVDLWLAINAATAASTALNIVIGDRGLYRLLVRYWKPSMFERYRQRINAYGIPALAFTGFHINWLALTTVALASFRAHSAARLWLVALCSHALWSALLIFLISRLNLAALTTPAGGAAVIGAFFTAGMALCLYEHLHRKSSP